MRHTDHLSTLVFVSFFKHLIQNRLSAVTSTIISPVVSDNRQSLFVCFLCINTMVELSCYIFLLTYSILSIIFSNIISTDFIAITEDKVILFFVFDRKLFLWFNCFYYLEQHKVIVWVILTIYPHYLSSPFSKNWFGTDSHLPLQPWSLQS